MDLDKTRVKLFPNFTRHHLIIHTYHLFHLIIALKNEVCYTFIPHVLSYNGFGFNMVFVSWVKIA